METALDFRIVKGNPTPEIAWKYQSADEHDFESSLPSEVYAEENKLKIPVVTTDHKGTYRCVATNMMGEGYRDVTVKIQCKSCFESEKYLYFANKCTKSASGHTV